MEQVKNELKALEKESQTLNKNKNNFYQTNNNVQTKVQLFNKDETLSNTVLNTPNSNNIMIINEFPKKNS